MILKTKIMEFFPLCLSLLLIFCAQESGGVRHNCVETSESCLDAADSLGVLLSKAGESLQPMPDGAPSFREIIYILTDWDLLDADERNRFLCRFNNLRYLDELEIALSDVRIEYQATRIANAIMSTQIGIFINENPHILQENQDLGPLESLVAHLYNYSFTNMDQSGQRNIVSAIVLGLVEADIIGNVTNVTWPDPAPSPLSTIEKCFNIIKDIYALKYAYPDGFEAFSEGVYEYAGLDLNNDDVLQAYICESAYSVNHTDLYGIHRIYRNYDIFLNALKKGYPYIVEAAENVMKSPQPGPDRRRSHVHHHPKRQNGPAEDPSDLLVYVKRFLKDLKAMGLFSLKENIEI